LSNHADFLKTFLFEEERMAWKWILIVTILMVLIVFTAQNYEPMQIRFLAWSFKSSSAITVFISMAIGFLIGLLMSIRKD
jgi:uncharacterized integral membrane protein